MTYSFRPAQRSEAKPLIGIYSESGCGKTLSSLLLARGFVGPTGRIGMIETESGRGEAYADAREYPEIGGYDVLPMRDNFSPKEYGEAITAAETAKLDALIIDSASHEWEGAGGVLSMAAAKQASGVKGVLAWQAPKMEHQRSFMLRFMQSSIPLVILNMRAKYPMREVKNGSSKEWVRSDVLEPKQADDILFEMFVHGWIGSDHKFNLTKCTAKSLEPVFASGKMISLDTGRALAAWAAGGKPAPVLSSSIIPDGEKNQQPPESDYAKAVKARAELIASAEIAAKGGFTELKAWWQRLPTTERDSIASEKARLTDAAHEADRAAATI